MTSHSYPFQRPFRRQSWPVYSLVEEEKTSLAKEAHPSAADSDRSEACIPGAIDQQPIILDVEELLKKKSSVGLKGETGASRRVKIEEPRGSDRKASKPSRVQIPASTPDISKSTEFVDFAERHSTPYAFTPKREPRSSPTDSGYSSSSDLLLAEKRKQARAFNDLTMSDALRGQGKLRESHHQRRPSGLSYNGERHRNRNSSYQDDRDSTRPPPSYSDVPRKEKRDLGRESGAGRPRLAAVKADALDSPRRSSDTATTLPRPYLEESPRSPTLTKPPPLATLAARNNVYDKDSDTRSDKSSRPSSPVPVTPTLTPSPPRSPRPGHYRHRDELRSSRSSGRCSHPGSKHGSRASSPVESMRRSSTCPNFAEDRMHRPSRSTDSTFSMDELQPRDAYAPYPPFTPKSALPYPVDDMGLMPSEEDHRYRPRVQEGTSNSFIPAHRDDASSPTSDRRSIHGGLPPSRPRLPSRHTASEALPKLRTKDQITSEPLTTSPTAMKGPDYRGPPQPPPCPKPCSTRGSSDWYTLQGLSEFDMCPECFFKNFKSTRFRDYFKLAKPKDPKQKTKCDFANQWIRLAWLMTQQQQRKDLDLIYAIARIGANDSSCPGDRDDARTWYTLVDKNGEKVAHFDVCKTDVKRIEALMPQLHDMFVKGYQGEQKVRMCDLRTESHRFEKYLDVLYGIVEKAEIKRRPPDVQQFVDFVRQRAQMRECRRGKFLPNRPWHIMPELPEFTVCEECYTDVVWPAIEEGSWLASKFQKTPKVIYNDEPGQHEGVSCQLYSARMRDIFQKAVTRKDLDYLEWRVHERQRMERTIKSQEENCRRLKKQLEGKGNSSAEMTALQQRMQDLKNNWKEVE